MISIVIPILRNDAHLSRTLNAIKANVDSVEVILAVADPTAETLKIAEQAGARVLISPVARRATQMNLGAQKARGEILVFLHADTSLPIAAFEAIQKALQRPGTVGGAFARRYEPTSTCLRATCFLAGIRSQLFGWFLGDQAIFVRRDVFQRLGGFSDYELFEDLDFSRRLRREGRVVTLRPPVTSSARRFAQDGAFRRTLSDMWLTLRYMCGADPNALAHEIKENLSQPPPRVHSRRDGLCPPASPRAHCKDAPYQSADLHEPADGSRLPI